MHRISSQQDILGAPATYMVAYTTERFRNDNPKTYQAFVAALREAHELIKSDPAGSAKTYLDHSSDKITVDETVAIIKSPESTFDLAPQSVMTFAKFMAQRGIIKTAPAAWTEMFFPEVQNLPGS